MKKTDSDERIGSWRWMEQQDRRAAAYIQFPLLLLALCKNGQFDLMDMAIDYGIVKYARDKVRADWRKDAGYRKRFNAWMPSNEHGPWPTKAHKAVAAAQVGLNIGGKTAADLFESWTNIRTLLRRLDIDPDDNRLVQIRIPKRRAFILKDGWTSEERPGGRGGFNENDVRVLLAITSKQGNKDYVIMSREEIAFRAEGAKDEQQWQALGKPPLLSPDQVYRSVLKLTQGGWFLSRVLVGNRLNFFSCKLSIADLRDRVQEWVDDHAQPQKQGLPVERIPFRS